MGNLRSAFGMLTGGSGARGERGSPEVRLGRTEWSILMSGATHLPLGRSMGCHMAALCGGLATQRLATQRGHTTPPGVQIRRSPIELYLFSARRKSRIRLFGDAETGSHGQRAWDRSGARNAQPGTPRATGQAICPPTTSSAHPEGWQEGPALWRRRQFEADGTGGRNNAPRVAPVRRVHKWLVSLSRA